MTTTFDQAVERDLSKQQTLSSKQTEWAKFLSRLRGGKPANTLENFTFLVNILEQQQKLVTPENLHAALLANLDYLPSGFDRSAEIAAQQRAQAEAAAQETAAINAAMQQAEETYGIAADTFNANHLSAYLIASPVFKGKFSQVALDAWIRENFDVLHKIAQPTPATTDPVAMLAKQNRVYSLEDGRRDREAANAKRKEAFLNDMQNAKGRAEFQASIASIRRHCEMCRTGIDHAASARVRIEKLTALRSRFPQWLSEVDSELARQQRALRF